jgi:hypothetical protein
MKRLFTAFLMSSAMLGRAQMSPLPATAEVNWIHQAHSFDVSPNVQFYDAMDTYVYCMYPQWTNHCYSWSHSGSNLESDYKNDELGRTMPFFNAVDPSLVPWDIFLAGDDNGGYAGAAEDEWNTNIMAGPFEGWNGTGKTNEGVTFPATIKHLPIGGPPEDSETGGGAAQIERNNTATNRAGLAGVAIVDNWHCLWTNGFSTDVVGDRKLGFYPGNHLYPAGYLCMALWDLIMMGAETNIGSCVIDYNAASISATNHMVISGLQRSGNTLTWTHRFDRMPGAWDVGPGTNGCDDAFAVMPQLADRFRWTIQITNLPTGIYRVSINGSNVVTLSSSQLSLGWNMFAVTNGPPWHQRKAVLNAKRDQEGNDHVTLLPTHTAGDRGVGNNYDQINYYSSASTYPGTLRGSEYISAMAPVVGGMRALDVVIHDTAQPTNYTFGVSRILTHYRIKK